ncbi:MAG: hypothetical protein AAGA30_11450, partial [Planctomycetota bacterium]
MPTFKSISSLACLYVFGLSILAIQSCHASHENILPRETVFAIQLKRHDLGDNESAWNNIAAEMLAVTNASPKFSRFLHDAYLPNIKGGLTLAVVRSGND